MVLNHEVRGRLEVIEYVKDRFFPEANVNIAPSRRMLSYPYKVVTNQFYDDSNDITTSKYDRHHKDRNYSYV